MEQSASRRREGKRTLPLSTRLLFDMPEDRILTVGIFQFGFFSRSARHCSKNFAARSGNSFIRRRVSSREFDVKYGCIGCLKFRSGPRSEMFCFVGFSVLFMSVVNNSNGKSNQSPAKRFARCFMGRSFKIQRGVIRNMSVI